VSDVNTLTGLASGTTMMTVEAKTLAKTQLGINTSNFAYSIWFYVNDWNYRYGESKIIFGRMGTTSSSSLNSLDDILNLRPCPAVVLDGLTNTLYVALTTWPGDDSSSSADGAGAGDNSNSLESWTNCSKCFIGDCSGCYQSYLNCKSYNDVLGWGDCAKLWYDCSGCYKDCSGCWSKYSSVSDYSRGYNRNGVGSGTRSSSESGSESVGSPTYSTLNNVPIQKWVNLLISVYGRSLDIYLDGKLVKTEVLPGVAYINSTSNVYVTPNGGFSGWTSKFQYYPNPIDPQTAWNIYQQGYGASILSKLFGKYQVKFSLIENGSENSSLTI